MRQPASEAWLNFQGPLLLAAILLLQRPSAAPAPHSFATPHKKRARYPHLLPRIHAQCPARGAVARLSSPARQRSLRVPRWSSKGADSPFAVERSPAVAVAAPPSWERHRPKPFCFCFASQSHSAFVFTVFLLAHSRNRLCLLVEPPKIMLKLFAFKGRISHCHFGCHLSNRARSFPLCVMHLLLIWHA